MTLNLLTPVKSTIVKSKPKTVGEISNVQTLNIYTVSNHTLVTNVSDIGTVKPSMKSPPESSTPSITIGLGLFTKKVWTTSIYPTSKNGVITMLMVSSMNVKPTLVPS